MRRQVALCIAEVAWRDRRVGIIAIRLSIVGRGEGLELERCRRRETRILLTGEAGRRIDWVARKLAIRESHARIDRGPPGRMGRIAAHVNKWRRLE